MRERFADQPAPEPSSSLDLHTATVLLVASFNHSQGNEALQNLLFDYLRLQHPHFVMTGTFTDALQVQAQAIVHRLLRSENTDYGDLRPDRLGHKGLSCGEVDVFLSKEIRKMQTRFMPPPVHQIADQQWRLIAKIAQSIVIRDHHWIVEMLEGRPNRRPVRNPERVSHWTDAYFSYVVEHALKRHPTEAAEFDRLYAEIGALYRQALSTRNRPRTLSKVTAYSQLVQVIRRYNRTHPKRPWLLLPDTTRRE